MLSPTVIASARAVLRPEHSRGVAPRAVADASSNEEMNPDLLADFHALLRALDSERELRVRLESRLARREMTDHAPSWPPPRDFGG
ncbi:MAG TPA: hypothetical protein VI589_06940 [Vicinamibacteria bacterium]